MHLMEVKGAKPGRFTPRCASCKRKFALVVPDDAAAAPTVAALAQTQRDEPLADDITAALGIEKTPVPQAKVKRASAAVTSAPPTSTSSSASVTAPPPSQHTESRPPGHPRTPVARSI